jgi:hypothetical protein
MATNRIEYRTVRYVPNVISNESLSLAVIFTDACDLQGGVCTMIVAALWPTKVQQIDPDCDLKMIEALLSEIQERLLSTSERVDMIRQLDDSFSNLLQVSDKQRLPAAWCLDSIEEFAHELMGNASATPGNISSMPIPTSLARPRVALSRTRHPYGENQKEQDREEIALESDYPQP